jgi:hypothetical protein
MDSITNALKEWNVAVNALDNGKTILLLRKGGIREQGGNFNVHHQRVLLYPTFEHQQPELLKSEYKNQVTKVASGWHPETIIIRNWAEITDTFLVVDQPVIKALLTYHIWNEKFVLDRLKWKANQPIYVLLLRTYKLAKPQTISYNQAYGGCRSWIDLVAPIALDESLPVFSDSEYIVKSNEIKHLIASPQL